MSQYGRSGTARSLTGGFRSVHATDLQSTVRAHSGLLNGSSAFVDMGNVAALNRDGHSQAFSVSAWVYLNSLTGFQQIITKRDIGGTTAGLELGKNTDNGDLVLELSDGSNKIETTYAAGLTTGQWYLLVLSVDGSGTAAGAKVYIGSQGVVSTPTPSVSSDALGGSTANTAPFRIGCRNNGTLFLNGLVDEVGYWSRALSLSDVTAYYNFGAPTDLSGQSGIVSYWRFQNTILIPADSLSTIYDRVASNDGTNNGVTFSSNVPTVYTLTATFDGTTSHADMGTAFNWDYTQPFSINVWVKPQLQLHGGTGPGGAQQTIVCSATFAGSEGSLTIAPGFRFSLIDNADDLGSDHTLAPYLQLFHDNASRLEKFSTLMPMLNTWSMVTVSYDGSGTLAGVHLYFDGAESGSNSQHSDTNTLGGLSIAAGSNPLLLGVVTYPDAGPIPYYFKGNMANLNIWTRAISGTEVAHLYSAGKTGNANAIAPTNLTSSYPMQSPSNENLTDTNSSNNGTATAITWSYAS